MLAVKGLIQGNSIVTEENIKTYEGREVIITILDDSFQKSYHPKPEKKIDFHQYVTPTERGRNVEAYMEEMRGNDRI